MNIALKLRFDGSAYHGWQIQKSEITVAGTLEDALSRLYGFPIRVSGCGRTDAGVHAEVYCANFKLPGNKKTSVSVIPPDRLPFAINTYLPDDVAVLGAMYVSEDFDANLSCVKKEYTYRIICSHFKDPFFANRAHFYPHTLDIESMKHAARHYAGTHDFAALRSAGTNTKTTVRTIFWYEVELVDTICGYPAGNPGDTIVQLRACANGFLYNMARAMAGTLIYVSEGKISPDDIPSLLEQKNRCLAGPTLPPGGLYLTKLLYNDPVGEMF